MSSVPVVAGAIRAWRDEQEPVLRLWAACDLVEMTVRLASLVGLAETVARGGGTVPTDLLRQVRPRFDEPTLGKWQGIALATGAYLQKGEGPRVGASLHTLVGDEVAPLLDGDDAHDPNRALRAMRNRLAHGGGMGRSTAEQLIARWSGPLDTLCARLEGLSLGIAVRSGGEWVRLVGADAQPGERLVLAALDTLDADEQVAAFEGDAAVGLGPLAVWGPLRAEGAEALQVYARRADVRVLLTPIAADDLAQSEANPHAAATHARWFKGDGAATPPRGWTVQGFEAAMLREAQAFVGRSAELDACVARLSLPGVWAVLGRAGTGKSLLMARIVQHLAGESLLRPWLAWRFKAGDARCHRASFLTFLAERLATRAGAPALEGTVTLARVMELARSAGPTCLLVDGLDEILELDPEFADVLARLVVPASAGASPWTVLLAGRPDPAVHAALPALRACEVFPQGLPLMGDGDIRTMLLERLGPMRRVLLRHDRSVGEGAENLLVTRIAQASGGLPLYVNYVLGDLLSGRLQLDRLDSLPPTLAAYHDQLLRRGTAGDIQIVATWALVAVCLAREPLDPPAILALLVERGLVPDAPPSSTLLGEALTTIGGLLREERGAGLVPYHHSLRQHVLSSPHLRATVAACAATLEALAERSPAAPTPRPLVPYLLRHGGSHLVASGRLGAATARLAAWQARMDEALLRRDLADLVAALERGSRDPVEPATLLQVLVLRPENALVLPGAAFLYRHSPDFLASEGADAILLGVALTYALAIAMARVHQDTLALSDLARLRAWAADHACPVQYAALYALNYLAMRHPSAWPTVDMVATATGGGRPPPAGNVYDRMVVLNHLAYRASIGEDPAGLVPPGHAWGSRWPYLVTDEALAHALYAWRRGEPWTGAHGLPPATHVAALIPALDAIEDRRRAVQAATGIPTELAFVTEAYWTLLDRLDVLMLRLDDLMVLQGWYDLGCLLLAHPAWQVGEAAAEALSRRWREHPEDRARIHALAARTEPFEGAGLLGDRDLAMPTLARMLLQDVENADAVLAALAPFLLSPSSHQRAKAVLDLTQILRGLSREHARRLLVACAPTLRSLSTEADVWAVHELVEWVRVVEEGELGHPGFDPSLNPLLARVPGWRALAYDELAAMLSREA